MNNTIPEHFKPIAGFNKSTCFGCGPENPAGLRLKFYTDGNKVITSTAVPRHYCGWQNVVHGGILSTMLDEIMGWTAITVLRKVVLTKSMTVDFVKPIFADQEILVQAKLGDPGNGNYAELLGSIYNRDNRLCAESRGRFRIFSLEEAENLGFLYPDTLKELWARFGEV